MLKAALVLAGKDIRQILFRGAGAVQAVLLGLLLVFIFSLAAPPGQKTAVQAVAAVFWLATCFGLVLIFNTLYRFEEQNGLRTALSMAPFPVQGVWLGKLLAGLAVLICCQAVFLPALIIFLGVDQMPRPGLFLQTVLAVDVGLCVLGSLLGSVSQGREARDSLISIILFPMLLPLLLGGIRLCTAALGVSEEEQGWMGLILAFDVLFAGAGLLFFPFVYRGEE